MLRACRLAQSRILDRLLEEISRLTSDAEPINAAARKRVSRRDITRLALPDFVCPGVGMRQTRIPGNRGRRCSLKH
ncbi:hypothetical protein, partial [Streptomyces sp. NPDC058272]|uniref:hypothetical protein n=1 Tax=Streptomyces sp. NPDC058272 TaxID=3346415 RepID=UPI0036E9C044